ncbi:hypothetical protein EAS64_24170 [Trebonia kvetii]|uniref:Molecular chaperone Hsp90 n=1 Tax=Trebonia kvetii TaxID=2480626 RepID=A0A6P2BZ47_9ACTN|nr:hypothetical protein [Trebonia kvetii]TVZ03481.1 hypothetical protein EAS64_24170 [Trebonia kvetii]
MPGEVTDPYATAALRARVLDAWAASPSRFREDANAEEDYALGGYRDRVIVELAQNAADAAARAGVPGRLRLTLRDGTLTAANTGAPLDAAGVESLSTLRASSKRGDAAPGETAGETVGRFGVGFAAVVAVSDAPRIQSADGSVAWSRAATRDLVTGIPALSDELAARAGQVPVLRLPFADLPGAGSPGTVAAETGAGEAAVPASSIPGEYATVVELPLRDADAVRLVTRLLAETGPALLLALPALAEVEIDADGERRVLTATHAGGRSVITVDGDESAWRVASGGGGLDPALLADRPAEERARTSWSVRWAIPVRETNTPTGRLPAGVAAVVHAPTPTDEPLGLPALLLASFPLSPDRRHVAPGPLTDFLVERAAAAYAALLPELAPAPSLLGLVPGPVASGELAARLSRAIVALLPDVPFLPAAQPTDDAAETGGRVRPRDAVLPGSAAPGLTGLLAPVLPHLIDGPSRHPAYAVLGVRRMPLAELADLLAGLGKDPAWWRELYAALADVPAEERAELGALPVPLADGRMARGPRGLLLPGPGLEQAGDLAVLGLRVVDPAAAHPLLARLGAVEATPRSALEDPATRAAVATSYDRAVEAYYDDDSPHRVADAVLGLLRAVGAEPGDYPWLAELALPGDDGDWYPAGELLLPGCPLADLIADDAPFGTAGEDLVDRYGAATLEAAGVLSTFGLITAEDVEIDEDHLDLDLDGVADWAADTRDRLRLRGDLADGDLAVDGLAGLPPVAPEFTAVRDLDLVGPDRWPRALELLTRPPLRAALTEPLRLRLPDGGRADVPSYTAWWLRRHLLLGGRRPGELRTDDSDPLLAGLYDVISAAGARQTAAQLAAADLADTEPGQAGLAAASPNQAGLSVADQAETSGAFARMLADPAVTRALGVRVSLTGLLAEPGGADELLTRLADHDRPVTRAQLRSLWSALATADGVTADQLTPPDRVRAVHGDKLTVADADDVLILDTPDLWPLAADRPLILAPYEHAVRLADLLDLPLASEEIAGAVESDGEFRPVPDVVREVLPEAPAGYREHDRLLVDGADLPWRCTGGEVHAATAEGLAHGLAWAAGRWSARHLVAELLLSPEETARILAEADLDAD